MSNETSLDRFLKNRAAVGLGLLDKRITMMQTFLGSIFGAAGLSFLLAGTIGPAHDVVGAAAPMFAACIALLTTSTALRRRFRHLNTSEWRLTPEAKGLLLKLVRRRLGWLDGGSFGITPLGVMGRHTRRRLRHIAWDADLPMGFGPFARPPADVSQEVLAVLEVAAEHYNRIAGMLHGANSNVLVKLSASASAAADEAMADVLDKAATLDRYPESAAATRKQIDNAVHALKELGDRLEEIATRDQLLMEKVDYSSKMDSVLEELRLEQLARSELQSAEEQKNQANT